MGDGGVAWLEESITDPVTKDKTFSIDSLHGDGDIGREDVKDDMGRDRFDVGKDGGDGGAKGNLLDERVCIKGRKHRKGDSRSGRAGAKGNRRVCQRPGGSRDSSGGELDHGK